MKRKIYSWGLALLCCLCMAACGATTENQVTATKEAAAIVETEAEALDESVETESKSPEATEIEELEDKDIEATDAQTQPSAEVRISVADIPAYSGNSYIVLNDNVPLFLETDLSTSSYEYYSELDALGRCGVAYACIGRDLMPTEERGNIGSMKPTGWHLVKYDVVDGNYLYNRCHLIGYQLSGENANIRNLITGTRYMNVDGMLPFENMVADYVKETGNHVMYRVTPVFEGDNLLANGVEMEAQSIEDNGEGIQFHVYCYNVQPEVTIDYTTGESSCESGREVAESEEVSGTGSLKGAALGEVTGQSADADTDTDATGSSNMVWVSETGSKYHSINHCGRMNPDKAYQMTETEAINAGLGKCSKCW